MKWKHTEAKTQQPPRPPKTTAKDAELLRFKLQLEDEIKRNYPDQKATAHFYDCRTKPYKHQKTVGKEPDEPP